MGLPGFEMIETPQQARIAGRRWNRMATEIDTPDASDEVKAKARELRSRASAAHTWARQQDAALAHGRQAHDTHVENENNVVPIRPAEQAGEEGKEAPARPRRTSAAARRAGHVAYHAARPRAMSLAVRGKTHFFQGVQEPFGPVGGSFDTLMWALGASLGVVLMFDLVKAPGAITQTSSHLSAAISRAAGLVDPITGQRVGAASPAAATRPAPTTTKKTATAAH